MTLLAQEMKFTDREHSPEKFQVGHLQTEELKIGSHWKILAVFAAFHIDKKNAISLA